MHGKKRSEYKAKMRDPKTAAALSQKAEQWHQLVREIASRRPAKTSEEAPSEADAKIALGLLEKALLVNPDPLYLWNHRREWIVNPSSHSKSTWWKSEAALTQSALQKNPKAYGAWMHRKFMVQFTEASPEILQQELALTQQFLGFDERNFHCWNYRRFIVGCLGEALREGESKDGEDSPSDPNLTYTGQWSNPNMGVQLVKTTSEISSKSTSTTAAVGDLPASLLESEWQFTTNKIQDNFSNFSAFFYRSQLLGRKVQSQQEEGESSLWEEELELVENAVCTEPDDQTAWWYQALLLDHELFPHQNQALQERLDQQAELFRELLEEEAEEVLEDDENDGNRPQNHHKWILLGLFKVLGFLEPQSQHRSEQISILKKLQVIDPDRSQRYQQLLLPLVTTETMEG